MFINSGNRSSSNNPYSEMEDIRTISNPVFDSNVNLGFFLFLLPYKFNFFIVLL